MPARLSTRSVLIDLDDVCALCKTGEFNGSQGSEDHSMFNFSSRERTLRPAGVELYTRLREGGGAQPLLHFTVSGRDAIEVWETASALARADGEFALCGRWVLRPRRVRLVRYTEPCQFGQAGAEYTVYIGMTDDRAGGWVAKIQLDLESGRALEAALRKLNLELAGT